VIGAFGRVEIWDAGRWDTANRGGERSLAASDSGLDDLM